MELFFIDIALFSDTICPTHPSRSKEVLLVALMPTIARRQFYTHFQCGRLFPLLFSCSVERCKRCGLRARPQSQTA